jgi:hypothetical protein
MDNILLELGVLGMLVVVETTKGLETAISRFRENKHEGEAMTSGRGRQEKIVGRE